MVVSFLQTICKKDIVDSNENPIKCLGCIGVYAQFVIKHSVMQDGSKIDKLLVAHEGIGLKKRACSVMMNTNTTKMYKMI